MSLLGVMQGRLLPKYKGRFQAHPVGYWMDEFALARAAGLDCIEFILDYEDVSLNPLMSPRGIDAIRTVSRDTGVVVRTICADYFMQAPLHSEDRAVATRSLALMRELIASAQPLGMTDIVLPCVDESSLGGAEETTDRLVEAVHAIEGDLEHFGVNVSLETDLPPQRFRELLDRFDSPRITVNYDTGNSASLGYDPVEEFRAYGGRISDVHLKDRVRGGGSVLLGTGDVRFDDVFAQLRELGYRGPIIMQAYRDDDGVQVFARQLEWIRPYLTSALDESSGQ